MANVQYRRPIDGIKAFYIEHVALYFQELHKGKTYPIGPVWASACEDP